MDESNAFKWVSEARILDEQIKLLKIDSNVFLQFMLWRSLTESYRQQLINVSGSSRPSSKQILENIFDAHTRISDVQKFVPKEEHVSKNTITLATSVEEKHKSKKQFK